MKPLCLVAMFLFVGVGCGGSSGATMPGDGGVADMAPLPPGAYRLSIGPIAVPGGVERTQCVIERLGNPAPIHVGSIHDVLGLVSHHMIVYRVNDTVEQKTPFDCKPFTDTLDPQKGSPLVVSQKKDDLLTMPDGVGYTLDANQMIRIELHYINASTQAATVTASTTLIPAASYQQEAGFLFIGDPDIQIAAHTQATLGPIFFPLESTYAGVKFFALTGHEHQFGTDVTVAVAANASDPGTMIYDVPNWQWSEPATVVHDPPITVPSGGGFRFTCTWNNTSANPVSFGESANDEMCFFWAYYYPSQGAKVCFHTELPQSPDKNFCCPGALECSIFN